MSLPAREPPADETEPEDAVPLEAPRAPTEEAWAAMSRAQQDEAIAALLASETQEELDERKAIEQAEARMEQAMSQVCSAILGILRLRGFAVDQGTEAQVLGCVDLAVLQRWQTRAMTVATVAEMFLDA